MLLESSAGNAQCGQMLPDKLTETSDVARAQRRVPLHVYLRDKVCRFLSSLKSCAKSRELATGRRLHQEVLDSGLEQNLYIACSLVDMYAKCRSMEDARSVFDRMINFQPRSDIALWNALLWGYIDNDQPEMAVLLLEQVPELPDATTFTAAAKACSCLAEKERLLSSHYTSDGYQKVAMVSLEKVMYIASRACSSSGMRDRIVANSLIDAYGKCGSPSDSRRVFQALRRPDVVSWTALILSYANNGDGETALQIFQGMVADAGLPLPSSRTFAAALKACGSCLAVINEEISEVGGELCKLRALETGMAVHARLLLVIGSKIDSFLVSSLMDMYVKCGSSADARQVFDSAWSRGEVDLVSWTVLLRAYSYDGDQETALLCFELMSRCAGCDAMAMAAALRACSAMEQATCRALEYGMTLHAHARERGLEQDKVVANALVDMYAKCKSMVDAHSIFDKMPLPDANAWTSLIQGYVDSGMAQLALELFACMAAALDPGVAAYTAAVKACSSLAAATMADDRIHRLVILEKAFALHAHAAAALGDSLADQTFLCNSLVDAYAKCRSMDDASRVFVSMLKPDVVSWNSIISGATGAGLPEAGLHYFELMLQQEQRSCQPDAWTFAAVFKAVASLAEREKEEELDHEGVDPGSGVAGSKLPVKVVSLERCMAVHALLIQRSTNLQHMKQALQDTVVANALLDAYSKCGDVWRVFQTMKHHDGVSWNSLIWSCATGGQPKLALELFHRGFGNISARSCAASLVACTSMGDLATAKAIHASLCRYHTHDLDDGQNQNLATSLVDTYAKCGRSIDAQLVFDSCNAARYDVAGWNALISGYGRVGNVNAALRLFDELSSFSKPWLKPNNVTFLCLLTACNHAGYIAKARECFDMMLAKHGDCARIEHYHCLIDMLGRSNQIDAAMEVLETMPFKPEDVTWTLILDACSKWKCSSIGRIAFKSLLDLRDASSNYVLSANMSTT